MINISEVIETNQMIEKANLDVRTITMGISLLDCIDADLQECKKKIYNKITTVAKDLVETGNKIEKEYKIPVVNKRISVTPIALIGGAACKTPEDFVSIAKTLDKVRPGGIIAFITSKGTMDKENPAVRKYIAQRAEDGYLYFLNTDDAKNSCCKGRSRTPSPTNSNQYVTKNIIMF